MEHGGVNFCVVGWTDGRQVSMMDLDAFQSISGVLSDADDARRGVSLVAVVSTRPVSAMYIRSCLAT